MRIKNFEFPSFEDFYKTITTNDSIFSMTVNCNDYQCEFGYYNNDITNNGYVLEFAISSIYDFHQPFEILNNSVIYRSETKIKKQNIFDNKQFVKQWYEQQVINVKEAFEKYIRKTYIIEGDK